MLFPFTKMQAVGNDFVVVEESAWPADTDWAALAIRLGDRRFSIGNDGLLVLYSTPDADIGMRMYNPDGTEDMCGNGVRCAVAFAVERNGAPVRGTMKTYAGIVSYKYEPMVGDMPNFIATTLGVPKFASRDLPMLVPETDVIAGYPLMLAGGEVVTISSVNTGGLHTLIWVDELPDDETFRRVSPQIENHALFPERTSVLWAMRDDSHHVHLRIWERGVQETLGCGTGAAAAYSIAAREGHEPTGKIYSKGGVLEASGGGTVGVTLRGAAYTVFTGTIAAE